MIQVVGAPFGHNVYVGPLVNNPEIEHGALINLLRVDPSGSIPEQGWRFVDPSLPAAAVLNALQIVWITHDYSGPFCNGDLQIGFNSAFPGRHYANPAHTKDKNLGPPADQWTTVYSDSTLILLFKVDSKLGTR